MAIEPGAMDAFVNESAPPPEDEVEGEGAEETEESEGGKFATLAAALEEFAEDVTDVSDELDADALLDSAMELEEDEQEILVDGVSSLDKRLQKELQKAADAGLTMEDAEAIAAQLEESGAFEDPARLAGWIFRACESLGGAAPEDEETEEEEPEEELDEEVEEDDNELV